MRVATASLLLHVDLHKCIGWHACPANSRAHYSHPDRTSDILHKLDSRLDGSRKTHGTVSFRSCVIAYAEPTLLIRLISHQTFVAHVLAAVFCKPKTLHSWHTAVRMGSSSRHMISAGFMKVYERNLADEPSKQRAGEQRLLECWWTG